METRSGYLLSKAYRRRKCYGSGMRSIRRYQFFRHASSDAALDHMRHLADLVIAAVLLVITFPLLVAVALAIIGRARPDL